MTPKSGSPGTPVDPAAPADAVEADAADPGVVEEIKAEQRETKSGKYGSVPLKPHKPPADPEDKAAKKNWVEIVLKDEEDAPVPGEYYRIILADGETAAEGTLDEKGFARVDGIDPGQVKIIFPALDQEAVQGN